MVYTHGTSQQPKEQQSYTHSAGRNDSYAGREGVWGKKGDIRSEAGSVQMAGRESFDPVYDLVDCGPRNRFGGRGCNGELVIVHNCGVAYTREGETVHLEAPDRIAVLREVIEESDGKVIVFVPLTGALNYVASELEKDTSVAIVQGATTKAERDGIFSNFQRQDDPRILVANPGTMSHGLTLTRATTIVWYAPIHSLDTYGQANARILRLGQKSKTRVVTISASPIEDRIYRALQGKEDMQNLLLDMLKNQ